MKAITLSLCLILSFILARPAQSQDSAADEAIRESVRRETFKIELTKKLAEAQAAQKRGDHFAAAKLRADCLGLVKKIGTGVEAEQREAISGMVVSRLQLAAGFS